MARRNQTELIRSHLEHRRTEGDYMGVLLGAVTLEDWRDVVNSAKIAAKSGDPQARAWLAQYLVGRPEGKAPTPLTVVVQQLSGTDPLVESLAKPLINRKKYPNLYSSEEWEAQIRALVAAELADKVQAPDTSENPELAKPCDAAGSPLRGESR